MAAAVAAPSAFEARGVLKPLPRLNISSYGISISGLSSGADFAAQFSVAFSRTIMGVGVFAGEPWHCSATMFPNETLVPFSATACGSDTYPGTVLPPSALFSSHSEIIPRQRICTVCPCFAGQCDNCPPGRTVQCDHCKAQPEVVDVKLLASAAQRMARAGLIDDPKYLSRMRAYTYCGTEDQSHYGATVRARDFYALFKASVLFNFSIPSGHCWPVDSGTPVPCGGGKILPGIMSAFPLQNCGYDGPGELLNHIYGQLKAPVAMKDANLRLFDQKPFNGNDTFDVGLGDAGLIYVPQACADGRLCTLHVSMHGCENPFVLEYPEAKQLSFNRWAEANDMVVLWPHNVKHGNQSSEHHACWDGYAQTPHYDTQRGPQMVAIASMIEAIAGIRMGR